MISQLVRAGLLAAVCVASLPDPAPARTPYDGSWTVLIVTQRGTCDRAYRYGVRIVDGNVQYAGDASVNLSGRVAGNGSVAVTLRSGGQRADGVGRLSKNSGGGTWRGQGSSGSCAGTWEAERRG